MTHAITQRIPVPPAGLPDAVEYRLGIDDCVAFWVYLARRAPWALPGHALLVLRQSVAWVLFAAQVLLVGTAVVLCASLVSGFAAFLCAAIGTPLSFLLVLPVNLALLGSPRLTGRIALSRPFRRASLWGLWLRARRDQQTGTLDTTSGYRFTMTAEGFTSATEQSEMHAGGVVLTAGKRLQAPWTAVERTGQTDRHVFLLLRDHGGVIVPRSAFADDASFGQFAEAVARYHRGAGPSPSSTAVRVREERVGAPSAPPATKPAPDERITASPAGN
jgi:hypothetical protein